MGHHVQGFMLDIDLVKGSTADDYLQLQASFLENKEKFSILTKKDTCYSVIWVRDHCFSVLDLLSKLTNMKKKFF